MSAYDPPDQALAATIRRLRKARGETQEDVVFNSGLSVTAYVRTERGASNPAWTTVKRIAAAFEMPAWELVRSAEEAKET